MAGELLGDAPSSLVAAACWLRAHGWAAHQALCARPDLLRLAVGRLEGAECGGRAAEGGAEGGFRQHAGAALDPDPGPPAAAAAAALRLLEDLALSASGRQVGGPTGRGWA
jgi:hypothetical protein